MSAVESTLRWISHQFWILCSGSVVVECVKNLHEKVFFLFFFAPNVLPQLLKCCEKKLLRENIKETSGALVFFGGIKWNCSALLSEAFGITETRRLWINRFTQVMWTSNQNSPNVETCFSSRLSTHVSHRQRLPNVVTTIRNCVDVLMLTSRKFSVNLITRPAMKSEIEGKSNVVRRFFFFAFHSSYKQKSDENFLSVLLLLFSSH